jgi:TonB family protein
MKFILTLIITTTFVLVLQSVVLSQSQNNNSAQSEKIYLYNEVDEIFKIKEKPKAIYTDEARQNGIQGTVLLKVVLKSSGKVEVTEVLSGLPHGLSKSAINAARKIKFEPAKKNGQKVSVSMKVEYYFYE